jgi:hypothetical protein
MTSKPAKAGDLLEGVRQVGEAPTGRLSLEAARALAQRGQVAYRELSTPTPTRSAAGVENESRANQRRRTRLCSAKVLDAAYRFVCEALVHDRSASGLRLLLARNVGLPARFGVHDDETGEIFSATAVWRRGPLVGARILPLAAAPALKSSERMALRNRYYAVPD